MKTKNANNNKLMIIIFVFNVTIIKGNVKQLYIQNSYLNTEIICSIACVGLFALLLFISFLKQKNH